MQNRSTIRSVQRTLVILTALLLSLAGCAQDPGSGVPEVEDTGRDRPDASDRDTPSGDVRNDTNVTGEAHLEFVDDDDVRLGFNEIVELRVRYVDQIGEPIEDAPIEFAIDEARAGRSTLRATRSRTDGEGIATVELVAGPVSSDFDVVASVSGAEDVDPITFIINVQPKDAADYIIRVLYGPDAPIIVDDAEVLLYQGSERCSAIGRDPNALPPSAMELLRLRPSSDQSFADYEYEAAREQIPINYAIAIVRKNGTPVGIGCTDGLPTDVGPGSNVIIEIPVTEIFPLIKGEFEVTNEFDLFEFLPPNVQNVVRYIGEFFSSPGATLFTILEDAGVFDVDDIPLGLGGLLADAIDGLLFAFLPPEAIDIFESGADLYDALQRIELSGSMIFHSEPNELGVLGDCNELILNKISVDLPASLGGPQTFNLASFGYNGAYGTFTGWISVEDDGELKYALNIQQFTLTINYGEIAVFLLETVVFPLATGDPGINSMEEFVESFIDCQAIADDIGWSGIETLCDTIIASAVDGLRGFLVGQTVALDQYVLETPGRGDPMPVDVEMLEDGMDWGPCAITTDINERENVFFTKELGGPGRERCVWDARFRANGADPAGVPVPAAFEGSLLDRRAPGTCGDGR